MEKKRTKKTIPPITAEVRPITPQAFQAGIKVPRYFSDPISSSYRHFTLSKDEKEYPIEIKMKTK
jgi:hypothetical protein